MLYFPFHTLTRDHDKDSERQRASVPAEWLLISRGEALWLCTSSEMNNIQHGLILKIPVFCELIKINILQKEILQSKLPFEVDKYKYGINIKV